MDLGLGNLVDLKAQLLAESLRAQTTYDAQITAIGKGVAGQFERRCNRRFARVANEVDTFSADRSHWILTRYPVEEVGVLETNSGDGWTEVDDNIDTTRLDNGLVKFGGHLGTHAVLGRLTYTGGYWYDTTEDASGVKPAPATALPDDLRLAWYLQCSHVWTLRDKLGQLESGSNAWAAKASILAETDLIPSADAILKGYVRYAIT